MALIKEIIQVHKSKKPEIVKRLQEFKGIWQTGTDAQIFREFAFCILTPQSRARACWDAVEILTDTNLLFEGSELKISQELSCVRFKNNKSKYLKRARDLFMSKGKLRIKPILNDFDDVFQCREWLVKNIQGFGYKEASHFLRNIGIGEKLAILDRHILKNLTKLGVIDQIPTSISRNKYLEIERKMQEFAKQVKIPLAHLDLLLWYKETGEIFK